jgi:hypothetical protein
VHSKTASAQLSASAGKRSNVEFRQFACLQHQDADSFFVLWCLFESLMPCIPELRNLLQILHRPLQLKPLTSALPLHQPRQS